MPIFRNSGTRLTAPRFAGLLAMLALPALLLGSCGGGVGEAALVVPFITFQFEGRVPVAGQLQRATFSLTSPDIEQKKTTGNLTANLAIGDTRADAVTGTYSGSNLQLTVPGAVAPLAPAYAAQFVEPDTIVLTPTSGTQPAITVLRVDNSFRPVLHDSRWTGKDAGTGQAWKVHFLTDPIANDFDGSIILKGDETVNGAAGLVSGYAVMRRIELDVVRGGRTVHLSGRMGPAGTTPPAQPDPPTPARPQTMTFSDGSTLARD
jgi:hypothetical protein